MLTHTERFCRKNLENKDDSAVREWGSWLRAPPRRVAMLGKSKWLREEGDQEWEARVGRDNCQERIKEFDLGDKGKTGGRGRNVRDLLHDFSGKQHNGSSSNFQNINAGINLDKAGLSGLDHDEMDGLNFEERKRRRSETNFVGPMIGGTVLENMVAGDTYMGTTLSNSDCVVSSVNDLAQSALQTSQPQ
ncbi:hypothetical protein POM88_039284 [Heracleum sosnowskyi]|uniref:Uncharacterized protein n=1 Tax=Heracleum sosnowskyi TaxID=360622 RepID=A0AAD8M970_9APIA|nr:hypothetical protein POM88_039284 [Heracleum sosnowskyi]